MTAVLCLWCRKLEGTLPWMYVNSNVSLTDRCYLELGGAATVAFYDSGAPYSSPVLPEYCTLATGFHVSFR